MSTALTAERTVRQKEIVESARRIIIAKGIESLTVREIARDLKITDGALYRHFRSKNEIMGLLIDDIGDTLLTTIKEAAGKKANPLQRLEDIFMSHLSYSERVRGTGFIVINESLSIKDKKLQRKVFAVLNQYLKTIKTILSEGIKDGLVRKDLHLDSASLLFFGTVQSLVTLWGLSGYRLSLSNKRLDEAFKVYKNGILSVVERQI
jgi:AcrR family transcriptional regulator